MRQNKDVFDIFKFLNKCQKTPILKGEMTVFSTFHELLKNVKHVFILSHGVLASIASFSSASFSSASFSSASFSSAVRKNSIASNSLSSTSAA